MNREKTITIKTGSDAGKTFVITPLTAYDEWLFCQEVRHAMGRGMDGSGEWDLSISISSLMTFFRAKIEGTLQPSDDPAHDLRVMINKALRYVTPQDFKRLSDKLLTTVKFVNDKGDRVAIMPDVQISDMATLERLIGEAMLLHAAFLVGANP